MVDDAFSRFYKKRICQPIEISISKGRTVANYLTWDQSDLFEKPPIWLRAIMLENYKDIA